MSILRGFRLTRLLLIILVSLVFLTTIPSVGFFEDDWVKVGSYDDFTLYYNSSSVKIDNQNKIITVWVKRVYTEKGKKDRLNTLNGIEKQKYKDLEYKSTLYLFDYKQWKSSPVQITLYSRLGDVLFDENRLPNWENIVSGSRNEFLVYNILKDYNIQR